MLPKPQRVLDVLFAAAVLSLGIAGQLNRHDTLISASERRAQPSGQTVAANVGNAPSQTALADVPAVACRLPAEFERQHALLIACHQLIDNAAEVFIDLVSQTHGRVELIALVTDDAEYETTKELLRASAIPHEHVRFVEVPHDTMWVRDYGPIIVQSESGPAIVVDARYQTERPSDDRVPQEFAWLVGVPIVRMPLRLDGGNLLCNGDGLALTTSRLLDPENAAILDRNAERLASTWTSKGRLQVVRVPMPPHDDEVWRTYTNVVYANGVLLVPTFGDVDQAGCAEAIQTFAKLLPRWTVIGTDATQVIEFSGALHCITMHVGPLQRVFDFRGPTITRVNRDDSDDITFSRKPKNRATSRGSRS